MSRRKYSFEERLKVVMHYFASDEGYRLTFARFNIPRTQVRIWVTAYGTHSEEGLRSLKSGGAVSVLVLFSLVKSLCWW